jgi:hypothetical protein
MSGEKKDGAVGPEPERLNLPPNPDKARPHNKKPVTLSIDDQQFADIAAELVTLKTKEIDAILLLAKWSLESVTHLTEYEDEKANRIMTAVAFLSALVSVAFAVIVQRYPFTTVAQIKGLSIHLNSVSLFLLYILFGVYFLLLTLGAAFTLYAVWPRFQIPSSWERTKTTPGSFLFFKEILNVSGKNWGRSFTQNTPEMLKTEYAKNSILETYLIAQKIPKKLRPLKKGIVCFFASTVILVLLLPLCAVTVAFLEVPATSPAPAQTGSTDKKIEIPTTKTPASHGSVQANPGTPKATDQKSGEPANKDSRRNVEKPE